MNTINRLINHYLDLKQHHKDNPDKLEYIDTRINALTSMLLEDYFA